MTKNFKIAFLVFVINFSFSQEKETSEVNVLLNNWHKAAAEADFDNYFNTLDDNSVFIGTDATEVWNKEEFMSYSKPYFNAGKAWSFTTLKRTVYFSKDKKMAWFDELLNTQMKICRGSGVLIKTKDGWKIKHYVLSMTIPNDNSSEIIKIKAPIEDALIETLDK